MRSRVCSGMAREAGELLRTLETVPAVSPRWEASDLRFTAGAFGVRPAFEDFFIGSTPGAQERPDGDAPPPGKDATRLPFILA